MKLSHLKSVGAVPGSLRVVSKAGVTCVPIATVEAGGGEITASSVVVLDDTEWIATSRKRPPTEASAVYSGTKEGDLVGCYKQHDKIFLIMRLVDDQLQTIRQITIKEDSQMDLKTDPMDAFGDLDLDESTFKVQDDPGSNPEAKEKEGKKAKPKTEEEQWVANIKSQLPTEGLLSRDAAVRNNRKYGRLVCFITNTNDVIKLSAKSKVQIDPNGKQVLKVDKLEQDATPEQKAAWEKKGKYPAKFCETEKYLAFNNAPPPKAKGMIIKVPAGTDIDIDLLNTTGSFTPDESKKDFVYKFLTMEMAYLYVAGNFGNCIKEDESVVGPRASTIGFAARRKVKSDSSTGATSQLVQGTFYLDKDSGEVNRKKLICSTNYFPAKLYETVPFSEIQGADVLSSVNLNVAQALAKNGTYEELNEQSKNQVTLHEDGTYSCTWFNDHAQISVKKYDAESEDDLVSDIRIPLRVKVPQKKDPTKMSVKYKYVLAGETGGPQDDPVYKRIIEATGMDTETFIEKVKKITARVSKPKATKDLITGDAFLSAVANGLIDVENITNFAAMGENMERLNA